MTKIMFFLFLYLYISIVIENEMKTKNQETMKTFIFQVHYYPRKYSDNPTNKQVRVKARDAESATRKVERRFKFIYDIELINEY